MLVPYPDLARYCRPTPRHVDWLLRSGVPLRALTLPPMVMLAHGHRAPDGCFEDDPAGADWLVFPEAEDAIYWQPRSGSLARWNNRAFGLGQDLINAAGTFAFGGYLHVFQDPLTWLRAGRTGLMIVDFAQTFDRLRDCPRLAAADDHLRDKLERHLKPPHLPEIVVVRPQGEAAA